MQLREHIIRQELYTLCEIHDVRPSEIHDSISDRLDEFDTKIEGPIVFGLTEQLSSNLTFGIVRSFPNKVKSLDDLAILDEITGWNTIDYVTPPIST